MQQEPNETRQKVTVTYQGYTPRWWHIWRPWMRLLGFAPAERWRSAFPESPSLRFRNWWQREIRLKTYRCVECKVVIKRRRHGDWVKLHGCVEGGRLMEYLYK